jgi:hypothetical protein
MSPNDGNEEHALAARPGETSALRRRHAATLRMEPYDQRGHRDPWTSGQAAGLGDLPAWRAAEQHLRSCGYEVTWVRRRLASRRVA